jgi:hypothetical protein
MKMSLKILSIVGAAAAMLTAAPASAFHVWMYYGGYGELVGYKVVNDDGTICAEEGVQSFGNVDSYYYPGDAC